MFYHELKFEFNTWKDVILNFGKNTTLDQIFPNKICKFKTKAFSHLVPVLNPQSPYRLTACKPPKTSHFLRLSAEQVEGCFYISKWNQQRQTKTVACHNLIDGGISVPRRISRNRCTRFVVDPPINKRSTEERCEKSPDELCISWIYPLLTNEAEEEGSGKLAFPNCTIY